MGKVLVSKRKNKDSIVWQYKIETASVNGTRKWITKSGFKTKKEATDAGQVAQMNYKKCGVASLPSEISYSDLLDLYIKNEVVPNCKETTVLGYEKKIRLYIKPNLGKYMITSISRQDIRDFLDSMYNEGFSTNTISSIKGIITASFNYALDNNLLFNIPSVKLGGSKGRHAPKTPTRSEPHVFVPAIRMQQIFQRFPEGTPNHIALMLGYHCGLRLSETFALTWDDVDFSSKTLQINRQVQWKSKKDLPSGLYPSDEGYWYFTSPKDDSYRCILLDDELCDLLYREKNKQDKARVYYAERYTQYYIDYPLILGGCKPPTTQINAHIKKVGRIPVDFINVRENGTYITSRTMQYTSSVIHHKLNYPEWDFHSLRHTHATMLTDSKAPEIYVQYRLGHSDIKSTRIYTNHLTESSMLQGNAILANLF